MPVQRTFSLIPPAAGAAAPAQPMTSKQVRAAHKAATRTAPMPRAERIRQERAEQERIRRELDREGAAARARAARQRRRDKEAGLREARRRKGLPLADVRPSQGLIAGFVRRDAAGRERGVGGGEGPAEVDLIPDEDELDLATLEQLDAVAARSRESGPAQRESSPAASGRSSHGRPRAATPLELDLGLRQVVPDKTPPPAWQKRAPLRPVPAASPPPAVQPPPAGTQAILFNLDDFFPSSSQQERELREDTAAADVRPRSPEPSPPPPATPPRFFTPTGDRELVTLALQRSRRTAAREAMQHRQGPRQAAAPLPAAPAARDCQPRPAKAALGGPSSASGHLPGPDKENVAPRAGAVADGHDVPPASQETEYGGDWVDEIAVEFTI